LGDCCGAGAVVGAEDGGDWPGAGKERDFLLELPIRFY